MSPGSERPVHVVIMEQHAAYPPPVLRPPVVSAFLEPSYPPAGHHGLWSPAAPPAPWYGGWNQWAPQPGYHQPAPQRYGGPRHYGQHTQQGNGCHGNKEYKKKKRKEPDYSHYCDTCDRGFKNIEKYEEHVSQHVKCQEADCNFRAHEKLMHGPGSKRIKLDTPDEIKKWREERRKNYPTLQTIAKKSWLQKEKEERGEVLKTAQFGKMKGMRNGQGGAKDKSFGKNRQHANKMKRKFRNDEAVKSEGNSVEPSKEPLSNKRNGKTVNPLDMLAGNDPESDSGEEPASTGLIVIPKQVTFGLSKLISSYGSSSENDSEPEELQIKKVAKALEENRQLLETHYPSMDSTNVKVGNLSKAASTDSCSAAMQSKDLHRQAHTNIGRNRAKKQVITKRRTTLLEMLLARDIRHERNVILQCVRYIVQNNFFDCTLNRQPQVTSDSSLEKPKSLNGEAKPKVKSWQNTGLDEKKAPEASSFLRPLEPVDDEIWEMNPSCVETFGV
ncbi:FMR1-interacting protein NUFIP1 isoform X2 [Eleutherodactylus coqui]|uniref:FMR1-interacting protein NUFIP1 isoform X2 n=1 Tax=Eleutherodactylus coqui TaxID=57060 RepID=UPI0034618D43